MYIVYQHKNKINGKMYIGITKQQPQKRWGIDGCNYKSSPHFYNAINKYGWDNFEHNILFENLSQHEACQKEQELIKQYQTIDRRYGYNSTTGGENPHMNKETKAKLSKALKGNKNGLGKACSVEKAKKISDAQKGCKFSAERKKKLSESAKRRHVPCSQQKRLILQNTYPYMKQIYCDETQTIYKSVQECARQLNIHPSSVSRVYKGKMHTTGGYHLHYYDDTINA